jgi:hypothetical protein
MGLVSVVHIVVSMSRTLYTSLISFVDKNSLAWSLINAGRSAQLSYMCFAIIDCLCELLDVCDTVTVVRF